MQDQISIEYNKLDIIDQKVLHWMMKNAPASVPSWIEYTVRSYRNIKGIDINPQLLLEEGIEHGFYEVYPIPAKLTLQD